MRLVAAIGPLLDTLRTAALGGRTFSDVAMERPAAASATGLTSTPL